MSCTCTTAAESRKSCSVHGYQLCSPFSDEFSDEDGALAEKGLQDYLIC